MRKVIGHEGDLSVDHVALLGRLGCLWRSVSTPTLRDMLWRRLVLQWDTIAGAWVLGHDILSILKRL